MWGLTFAADWVGVKDPWVGARVDLAALHDIVCQVLRVPITQCGPPVRINPKEEPRHDGYARVYSFQLPSRSVVARLVAPVKPLFKTEAEVSAMDFVRSRTSLPVPVIYAYCSEASNPVGAEWLIMEHVPGVTMGDAWDDLPLPQRRRLALDLIDLFDQLYCLKADGCGSIYHDIGSVDDRGLLAKSSSDLSGVKPFRSTRWGPMAPESIRLLKNLCNHSVGDGYKLGPLNDISLLEYRLIAPSPLQTLPVFTAEEYIKLLAFNGNPTTRSDDDFPTREKCVELFRSVHNLYPNSMLFGPSADATNLRFSHGDLHSGNILIDPRSGAITGIIDWEAAGFRPLWAEAGGVGWFDEDGERFVMGNNYPHNFETDTGADAELRAFFRTELNKRNPDLFACFLGGIELRAIQYAACDVPRPVGESQLFLSKYHRLGCWNEARRGAFPWDMDEWKLRRWELDIVAQERIDALEKAELLKVHQNVIQKCQNSPIFIQLI